MRNINIKNIFIQIYEIAVFVVLIITYVAYYEFKSLIGFIFKNKRIRNYPFENLYNSFVNFLDKEREGTISRTSLIKLSLKSMKSKKTRTWLTIGGMAIGIGLIVFLVSIGYGLEKLVVSRIARLEELSQTDVVPGLSSELELTDDTISKFKQISHVIDIQPVISAVGNVNYNNSEANMAVYGVTTKYLNESGIKASSGRVFENNDLTIPVQETIPEPKSKKAGTKAAEDDITTAIVPSAKENDKVNTLTIGGAQKKEVVINTSALKLLGLDENKAIDTKIKLTLIIVDTSSNSQDVKTQSVETEYNIIGAFKDDATPVIYLPFVDLKSLNVSSYSQIKIIVDDSQNLTKVRASAESMGYGTTSVVDTVSQIDSLFNTVRLFLGVLGVVALSVASLGMFNTLTVSLLERTREVGLMKAIGMKKSEVKELFMTESLTMGLFSGILGLLLGFLGGFVLNIILTLVAFMKGQGVLSVAHIPFGFAITIIVIALTVGILTGYIPAKRATTISALNALRYE